MLRTTGARRCPAQKFANWIALDGLASPVVTPVNIAVEPQTQIITSLIEDLRRRLPKCEQEKLPNASKKALDRIRTAAKDAAEQQTAVEQDLDPTAVQAVRAAVGHLEAIDYAERAAEVVAECRRRCPRSP